MQHPRFRSGELTTGFIAEEYPDGFTGAPASVDLIRKLCAIAGVVATSNSERARHIDGQLGDNLAAIRHWQVAIDKQKHDVTVHNGQITVDGQQMELQTDYVPGARMVHARADGEALAVKLARSGSGFRMTTRGASHAVTCLPAHVAPLSAHMIEKIPPDLSKFLICPMPGLITAVHVGVGDKVEAGQPLAIIEAMKMENILRAEKSGTVKSVNAKAGDSLAVDAIILEME
jgi:propionyl-CoA carboxylase alpha chain